MCGMWIFKLAAAVCVLLSGGGLGMRQSRQLEQKRLALQDALLFLCRIQVRLQTSTGFWPEELTAAAGDGGFAVLNFPSAMPENLSQEEQAAWVVHKADPENLLGDAIQPLCTALQCASTRTETLARLEYYIQLLQQRLENARQREQRDKKLYCQLGWLGGALLAVILW